MDWLRRDFGFVYTICENALRDRLPTTAGGMAKRSFSSMALSIFRGVPQVWMQQAGTSTTCFRTPSVLTQLGDQAVTKITKAAKTAGVQKRADFAAILRRLAQISEWFQRNCMSANVGQDS